MPDSVGWNSDIPPILALDTSSAQAALALYDGRNLSTRSWPADRSHTTTLLSEIHHLLDAAGLAIAALGAVGVAAGPGPFTALRVGFGVAKGFHLATGVPLIAVPTREITAFPFTMTGLPIVAAVTAGRGRLAWAWYEPAPDDLVERRPARNGTLSELLDELRDAGRAIVSGELDAEQSAALEALDGVLIPPYPLRIRQPAALAEIGWHRWRAGVVADAAALEPIYLSR